MAKSVKIISSETYPSVCIRRRNILCFQIFSLYVVFKIWFRYIFRKIFRISFLSINLKTTAFWARTKFWSRKSLVLRLAQRIYIQNLELESEIFSNQCTASTLSRKTRICVILRRTVVSEAYQFKIYSRFKFSGNHTNKRFWAITRRDSTFSQFRMGPVAGGRERGPCDIGI